MSIQSTTSSQVFDLLQGTWTDQGRGGFPTTVTSFDYRETLVFTRRDEKTLAYKQRTQRLSASAVQCEVRLPKFCEAGL